MDKLNDGLNEEQKKKRDYTLEPIDPNSKLKRQRVLDSSEFDKLFISSVLTISEYGAAEKFMEDINKSNALISSPGFEPGSKISGHESAKNKAMKAMAMSGPMNVLRDRYDGKDITILFLMSTNSPYNKDYTKIKSMLKTLSKYYGTQTMKDPRDII